MPELEVDTTGKTPSQVSAELSEYTQKYARIATMEEVTDVTES